MMRVLANGLAIECDTQPEVQMAVAALRSPQADVPGLPEWAVPEGLDEVYNGPLESMPYLNDMVSQGTFEDTDDLRPPERFTPRVVEPEKQWLTEPPDLEDHDALARLAYEAFFHANGNGVDWDGLFDSIKNAWRAAAHAVKTATILHQANDQAVPQEATQ